jgi:glycosyltransferase involved in cell wall biosynthesis
MVGDFLAELATNPRGMWRALRAWGVLISNAKSGLIRHFAYLIEAATLKRWATADGITHLHAHWSTNTAAIALLARRMGGPEFSFTTHGPDELLDWTASSLKFKVDEAAFVIAISHFCRAQLILAAGQGAADKIHIVGCGLDLEEFQLVAEPASAEAPFVCVGRLCPQKAQVSIVEATAQIRAKFPNVRVEMIGDGESRAAVEAAINRHDLHDNVVLLGWQDNANVRLALGRARALLLPSLAEGLPVVIMEALALGRPAISTFIAGIPELVDAQDGWIIPAGSVDDIATAMKAALQTPPDTLAAMGRVGRTRVEKAHDVNANAAKLIALFSGSNQG